MTQLRLPNDTNNLDNLRGGKLLHWMDLVAAVSAQKHCNNIVVTAIFIMYSENPIVRDVVTLKAKVLGVFNLWRYLLRYGLKIFQHEGK